MLSTINNYVNDIPESALAPVIINDLIFNVNFMGVRLSDDDQCSFGLRGGPLFDPVIASYVSGIGSREVG